MFKKLVFAAMLMVSVGAYSQKFAHVNSQEVFQKMPDLKQVETDMATLNESYKTEITKMEEEYAKKLKEFQAQADSLEENIKLRRMQEVQELQQRIENFYQVAQQDIQKKQQEYLAPVQQKVQEAIKTVGTEQGYTYIFDSAVMLHIGADATDATPIVKQKLGITN